MYFLEHVHRASAPHFRVFVYLFYSHVHTAKLAGAQFYIPSAHGVRTLI